MTSVRRRRAGPASASHRGERDVRDREVGRRQRGRRARDELAPRPRRRSRAAFSRVASTAARVDVDGDDRARSRAAPRRSRARPSRSRRRAGVPRRELEQQLEAEPRRRVGAGAERAARIDHDRERASRRRLPRRADPERPDSDRPVELAPAVLPAVLDLGRPRAPPGTPPAAARRRRVGVGGELDAASRARPPRTPRGQLDRTARAAPRPLRPDGDGDARARISGTRSSASRRSPRRGW